MKILKFLNNINNRTNGGFYIFIGIITLIVVTLLMMYFDIGLEKPKDTLSTSAYISLSILRFVIMVAINFIGFALLTMLSIAVASLFKWIKHDLFTAVKDAAKDDYDIDMSKKSKIKFE